MVFLLVFALFFSIPQVQTYAAQWLTKKLEEQYGISISLAHVRLRPIQGAFDARDIVLFDRAKDTLFYAQTLSVSGIDLNGLTHGQTRLGYVSLEKFFLDIQYHPGDSLHSLNRFLAELPQSTDTTETAFFGAVVSLNKGQVRVGDNRSSNALKSAPLIVDIEIGRAHV